MESRLPNPIKSSARQRTIVDSFTQPMPPRHAAHNRHRYLCLIAAASVSPLVVILIMSATRRILSLSVSLDATL